MGEGGHEHGIRPAEDADDGKEREDREHAGIFPHIAKPAERVVQPGAGVRRADVLRQAHREQPDDHGDEAEAINEVARRHAGPRHEDTRERRPDDSRAVHHRAVERDRIREILAAAHLDDERLPRGHVEGHHHAAERSHGDDLPRLHVAAPHEECEEQREHHRDDLCDDEHGALRMAIGDPAAPRGKKKHRPRGGRGHDAEQRRRAGHLIHQPAFRGAVDPIADERDELPDEKEPVVPVPECREHFPPTRGRFRDAHWCPDDLLRYSGWVFVGQAHRPHLTRLRPIAHEFIHRRAYDAHGRIIAAVRAVTVSSASCKASPGLCRESRLLRIKVGHVAVAIAEALRLAEPDAVNDGRVIQLIGNDRVLRAEQRLEKPAIRIEAGAVENRVLRPEKFAQLLFELLVHPLRAADETHAA